MTWRRELGGKLPRLMHLERFCKEEMEVSFSVVSKDMDVSFSVVSKDIPQTWGWKLQKDRLKFSIKEGCSINWRSPQLESTAVGSSEFLSLALVWSRWPHFILAQQSLVVIGHC